MKKLFLIPILLITIVACNKNKESEKVASVWYFNGQEINTKNVVVYYLRNGSIQLISQDDILFNISLYGEVGSTTKEWGLDTSRSCYDAGNCVYMDVGLKSPKKGYTPFPNTTNKLKGIKVNGKVQYHLEPTWFINYHDPTDSVLVSGDFNEP